MKNLKVYIDRQNVFAKLFKDPVYDSLNLTTADVKKLKDRVKSDLSPEALTCDGELPASQVRAKKKFLESVQSELNAIK